MRILHSLMFYPRGGSAFVARALVHEAMKKGHDARIVAGSLGEAGEFSHAPSFYFGLNTYAMAYDGAKAWFEAGRDPMQHPRPFHPSYEDRGTVPDRLFSEVSPRVANWFIERWTDFFEVVAREFTPDVIHMHHLTPQIYAVQSIFPGVPVVVHLHGTELKLLERLSTPGASRANGGRYGQYWISLFREAASLADMAVAVCPSDRVKALRELGITDSRIITIPNGVDVSQFRPDRRSDGQFEQLLKQYLVYDARGWDETGRVGTVQYHAKDVEGLLGWLDKETPLIVYVGRFLAVKRLDLLIEVFGRIRHRGVRAVLLIWGGYPGEWEGEHPVQIVKRLALEDVYFVGWRGHGELARVLPEVDILALPSSDESFGQVLLEAMACGVPVLAANRGGPPTFVDSTNGWLFQADDSDSLEAVLLNALSSMEERRVRGRGALRTVQSGFAWPRIFRQFERLYLRLANVT
jgi:glycosyltransferase involved in cell wall biosynthesis